MISSSRIRVIVCGGCLIAGVELLLSETLAEAATSITRPACDQCEGVDRFVRLQSVADESRAGAARQFAHPFVLTPEEWTALLSTLNVRRQAEGLLFRDPPGPVVPAFTPEDISYLSAALSQAFAQAQPHEMVVFGLGHLNSYQMTEITTGGWYVEGSSLHVVLANYHKVITMPSTRQLLWERPLRPDAGPHYYLVAGTHQTSVRDSGTWSSLFSSPPSELSISYQEALLGEPGDAATVKEPSSPPHGLAAPTMSLEDRLRMLKRLHDQGLITEDEYRAKKQQILDRL